MNGFHSQAAVDAGEGSAPWIVHFGRQMPWLARRGLAMLILLPIFVGTFYVSHYLRFEGQLGPREMWRFWSAVEAAVLIKLVVFAWFGLLRGWARFVTFDDIITLVEAVTVSIVLMVLVERLFLANRPTPRAVFLLDWGTTIVVVAGLRGLLRVIQERSLPLFLLGDKQPTLIVGANPSGEALVRAIQGSRRSAYHVAGVIDVDRRRIGTRIGGVRVIGGLEDACPLALRHGVAEVLIVGDALSGKQVRQLVDEAQRQSIGVKVLPSYQQLIHGTVVIRPRPVAIDDLLRREPVELEMSSLRQWLEGRTLLVTGSAGSIGSEICRQLLGFKPKRLVLVDRSETGQFFLERQLRKRMPEAQIQVCMADILDRRRIAAILREQRPQIVFHAAAYKHVPLMESHAGEAVKNIVSATRRLADLAPDHGVESFVMISTDKAVNPTSVMGACKRAAEMYVQSLAGTSACRFMTVRFGNVLDSAGSVVPVFRQQIAAGGPVTVTDPRMERFFMTIPEAARLVIQAGVIGNDGEILLLDMGEPVRIIDLAADMIRLSGLRVRDDIEIEISGLRPGEKLYEELHAEGETHVPTRHPKIVIADSKHRDPHAVRRAVEHLERLADEPQAVVLDSLRRLVSEYVPPQERAGQTRAAA
ncbi:MAG: nucleoside-diphosphate sugar epimerase/dehydratase [Pirellulales bacterium]|nr:nucleoside-diphosphate sugar epimerase/dehydratase [Thermoguttaceae bacterium]MDD4786251.1 nucleoside-diphosphate sugar epimerase/dehydratase [Pirellulales bacterium]NLZ02301.1 polysaccharide biosynthesis protein [Pirellulaceae bacterium]